MVSEKEIFEKYSKMWEKTMVDEDFRKQMKEDPKKAISKFMEEDLPESFTIKVVEPDPAYSVTFLMPPRKSELTDSDVDSVAGGGGVTDFLKGITNSAIGVAGQLVSGYMTSKMQGPGYPMNNGYYNGRNY